MAATGYTPISLYYSTTASAVPTSGNLANGELALNTADMKLYAKNSSGVVTLLASSGGASGSVTSVAASVPAFLSVTGSPITTSGTLAITLSGTALPVANGGTGLTTLTAGYIPFGAGTSAFGNSASLFWDNTNGRLGLGTALPAARLEVNAFTDTIKTYGGAYNQQIHDAVAGGFSQAVWQINAVSKALVGAGSGNMLINTAGDSTANIVFATGSSTTERLRIAANGAWGLSGANYGSSGQVLTSGGSGAAPTWATAAGGVTFTTKTANYTAVNGDNLFADTSAGSFTITLPASPSINNTVYIQDSRGTFSTYPLTVARNGQNIMGLAENLISSVNNQGFGLFYNGTDWRIY